MLNVKIIVQICVRVVFLYYFFLDRKPRTQKKRCKFVIYIAIVISELYRLLQSSASVLCSSSRVVFSCHRRNAFAMSEPADIDENSAGRRQRGPYGPRISPQQWEIILNCMIAEPLLGRDASDLRPELRTQLWENLAAALNEEGPASRSVDEWRRVWRQRVSTARANAAEAFTGYRCDNLLRKCCCHNLNGPMLARRNFTHARALTVCK